MLNMFGTERSVADPDPHSALDEDPHYSSGESLIRIRIKVKIQKL
jgi:hypothetical protein